MESSELETNLSDRSHVSSQFSSLLSLCFFCGEQAETDSDVTGTRLKNLKSLFRHLKVNFSAEEALFLLCPACSKLQQMLSNLIQAAEVIEMEIKYRLKVLRRVLEAGEHDENGDLRRAILKKCMGFHK